MNGDLRMSSLDKYLSLLKSEFERQGLEFTKNLVLMRI